MASVNWSKIKTKSDLVAWMRHNDKEMREENEHSNKNINKSLTWLNQQLCDLDEAVQRFDDRMDYLDRQPKANKRKDRVQAFMLEYPVPDGFDTLTPEQQSDWYARTLKRMYRLAGGEANVICWWIHEDEVHDYVDAETGEIRKSRKHIHFAFVPEKDGKLNAKKVYSKRNLVGINNALDAVSNEFGLSFLKGKGDYYGVSADEVTNDNKKSPKKSSARSDATVEHLKVESVKKAEKILIEQQKQINANTSLIAKQQSEIEANDERIAEQVKAMEIFDSKDIRDTRLFKHFKENALRSKETAQMIAKPFSVAQIQKNLQDLQRMVDEQMRKQKKQDEREKELESILPRKDKSYDRSL